MKLTVTVTLVIGVVSMMMYVASGQPPPPPPPAPTHHHQQQQQQQPNMPAPPSPTDSAVPPPTGKQQQFSTSVPDPTVHTPSNSGTNPEQSLSSSIPHLEDTTKKSHLLRMVLGARSLEHAVEKHPVSLLAVIDLNMSPRAEEEDNFYNKTAHIARILDHEYRLSKVRVIFTSTRHHGHNINPEMDSVKLVNQLLLTPKPAAYFDPLRLEEEDHASREYNDVQRHNHEHKRNQRIDEIGRVAALEEFDEEDSEEANRRMGPVLDRVHLEGTEGYVLIEHGRPTETFDAGKMHAHEIAQRVAAAASANLKILAANRIASFATASPREALVVVRKTCRTSRDLRKTLSPFAQFVAAKPEVFESLPDQTDLFVLSRVVTGMVPPGCKYLPLDSVFKDAALESLRAAKFSLVAVDRIALQSAGESDPSNSLHTPLLPLISKLVVPVLVNATHAGQMAEYSRSQCVVHLFHGNIATAEDIPVELRSKCVFVNGITHDFHQKTMASFGFTNRLGGSLEKLLVGVHYNGARYNTYFDYTEIAKVGGDSHQRRERRRQEREERRARRTELQDEERRRKYDEEDVDEDEDEDEDQQGGSSTRNNKRPSSGKGTVLRNEEPILTDEEEEEREREEEREDNERQREERHVHETPVFNTEEVVPMVFPFVTQVLAGKVKPVGRAPMPRHDDGVKILNRHDLGDIDEDDFHSHILGDFSKDSFVMVFPEGKCPDGCVEEKRIVAGALDLFITPLIRDSLSFSYYNFSTSQPHRYMPKEISETETPMLCMFHSTKKFLFFAHHRHRQSNARFYGGVEGTEEDSGHPDETKWIPVIPGTTTVEDIKEFISESRPYFKYAIRKRPRRTVSKSISHDEL